ncbi:MAG: TonB-dependent receptor [Bacteroidota bacterium]
MNSIFRTYACLVIYVLPLLSLPAQDGVPAGASQDTVLLDEVAVSLLPFKQSYQESAGGIFTLKPGTIDLEHMVTTAGLFNLIPGVYMAAGTYNTNRLVIRGVGSRTPYNTNRIRAYLDDIPLTSGDGVSTLEDQDQHAIGKMEILKGPASSLYGSGLGGVVRLSSPYPALDGFSASIYGEVGSFDTELYGVSSTFKNDRLAFTGGISRSASEGYRENSRYERSNAYLNLRAFGIRSTFSFTLSLVDLFARIPSSLNESDYLNEPWKAGGSWGAIKGFEEYLRVLGGISLETNLGKGFTNKLVLFTTFSDPYESRPFNILDDRSSSMGFRELIQYEKDAWSFSTGLEYFFERVDWQIYETNEGIQGSLLNDQEEKRRYVNASGMVQWRPSEKFLVDAGLNLNLLSYGLHTSFRADSTDQSGQYSYRPVLSPRLGISYLHHCHHHLYASAGHGFSAPSLEETLLPEGAINTELRPETGWNFELGDRGSLFRERIIYDITLYTVILDDLLVTERISEDIFTGANAGKALNAGLELWADITLLQSGKKSPGKSHPHEIKAFLSYTLSRNRFTDFVDDGIIYTGNTLPGIPFQTLNTILSGTWDPFEVNLHFHHSGGQWMDDSNSQKYDGHQLLHLQVSWNIKIPNSPFHFKLKGGVRNILNAHYSSMILVNAGSFGGRAPRYYYPGNPRQFHLGLSLHFR